ncbi:MAG: N-acetyl-gamma-glutamyl-phosphate reductase [Candidatus Saganbacteria bacterium]|nr:N-acetyl-gamma-glutamyl-phosphate reductase [Candidatus Saganbacteria bacterium]
MNKKIKAGLMGAAGYAGIGIIQILNDHPEAEISWLSSEEAHSGRKISDIRPSLDGLCDMTCNPPDISGLIDKADVIFLAVPNGLAMKWAPKILEKGRKVIDISADFRIKDLKEYSKWYKIDHASPGLVAEAVYGLPELFKDKIKTARLIANPGCYPTASILGIAPLVKNRLVKTESIIIDAKSGISGAGAALTDITHFPECNENIRAYAVASHRHNPEIDRIVSEIAGKNIITTFTPHLVPMNRGILATIYADLVSPMSVDEVMAAFRDLYKGAAFVRILEKGKLPATKYVSCSNYCDINAVVDERTNRVIVMSAIDNLVKGAAGQAVQNMNIMFGLDERSGLRRMPVYP